MTAEVGVMNQLGVALAADSAVTVGGSPNKIYQSAEKLFLLAERAPVASMVYGSATFMGYPWETIVKAYRQSLGRTTCDTLAEYVDGFLNYLGGNSVLFTPGAQRHFVRESAERLFFYLRTEIEKRLQSELERRTLSERDIRSVNASVISEELSRTRAHDLADRLPSEFPEMVLQTYREEISGAAQHVFGDLPMTRTTRVKLLECAAELIARKRWGPSRSGFVIAGFGEVEYYPSVVDLTIEGIVADHILFTKERDVAISDETAACIIPFAQQEMVCSFMEGIDPYLKQVMVTSTTNLFRDASSLIIQHIQAAGVEIAVPDQRRILRTLEGALTSLLAEWDTVRNRDYSSPILSIVASLPKDELAAMAEALVNLTKFKRRVSRQPETVAGPIDVAVVTKGDGFVWIKRKYYFSADLNPRFMSKYYGGRV
jgi:hypothetical protein